MSLLFDLTLRGSLATLLVVLFDRSLSGRMNAASRRLWWCFLPLAFLLPLRLPILPALARVPAVVAGWNRGPVSFPAEIAALAQPVAGHAALGLGLWLAGAVGYLGLVAIQTARVSLQWSRERLSTDHSLLELLEDCKAETGVTAPIGLVISNSVPSPAILGWLRPRILLPASLVTAAPRAELRPIFLHELAHFRSFDIPFNWLLTLVRALHWFNPLAHLGAVAWARFREEAADEAALRWMRDESGQVYGQALVHTLRRTRGSAVPFGALAIVESMQHLKKRIALLSHYRNKSRHILTAIAVSVLLASVVCSKRARAAHSLPADPRTAAIAAAPGWLKDMDDGQYAQSWTDASALFKSHLTSDSWAAALTSSRAPLGKCLGRKQVSAAYQKDPQGPGGATKGEFVVIQYESSFENMRHVVETLSFYKDADGNWRGVGYLLRP